jgi:hypothetical protein
MQPMEIEIRLHPMIVAENVSNETIRQSRQKQALLRLQSRHLVDRNNDESIRSDGQILQMYSFGVGPFSVL